MARVRVQVQPFPVAPNVYHLISGAPGVSFPDCSARSLLLCSYYCRPPVHVHAVPVPSLHAVFMPIVRYLLFIGWQSSSSFACLFALHQGLDTNGYRHGGQVDLHGTESWIRRPEGFCGLRQSPCLCLFGTVDAGMAREINTRV